jgi:hypothetical protein
LCVLSGKSLCDELVTRPEEFYRLWRVAVCNHETSWHEEAITHAGLHSQRNNNSNIIRISMYLFKFYFIISESASRVGRCASR